MNKFNVGDKVICVDAAHGDVVVGKQYVVRKASLHGVWVEDSIYHYCPSRFELSREQYTKEDVEKAMDVFEHFHLCRSKNNKYAVSPPEFNSQRHVTRASALGKLFPSEKHLKLKELQEQIKELQQTANELEKEINE